MIQRSYLTSLWPVGASGVSDRATRTRPQQALWAILLIAGLVSILCLYLYQASRITVTDFDINKLQRTYARLQRENSNMLANYAHAQSIVEMAKRAQAAGFTPPAHVQWLQLGDASSTAAATSLPEYSNPPPLTLRLHSGQTGAARP